jgi:hypothetical protein
MDRYDDVEMRKGRNEAPSPSIVPSFTSNTWNVSQGGRTNDRVGFCIPSSHDNRAQW